MMCHKYKKKNEDQRDGDPNYCGKYNELLYLELPSNPGKISSINSFSAETKFFLSKKIYIYTVKVQFFMG